MSNHSRHFPDFLSNPTEQLDLNILALEQLLYPAHNLTLDRHFHALILVVFNCILSVTSAPSVGGIAATPKACHIIQMIPFGYGAHKMCGGI